MQFPFSESIHYKNDVLNIENSSIDRIAEAISTPFYAYSQARLIHNITACKDAFSPHNIHIHYAVKANSNLQILKLINEQGLGVDLVSGGELYRAKKAGIPAEKMIFSGVGKNKDELIQAMEMNIGQFNVESAEELALLASLATNNATPPFAPINVTLRVNPDVTVDTHKHITTGKKGNKFGIDIELALSLFQQYQAHSHINLNGLAMHIGSQIFDVAPYRKAIQKLLALVNDIQEFGTQITTLDLGGGFGINYGTTDNDKKAALEFTTIANVIAEETKNFQGKIAVEPGRSLVADIGLLVSQVNYVKDSHPTPFLIIDAAMNDLMRPALYQATHPIKEVIKSDSDTTRLYDVVGPICESTDIFAKGYELSSTLKSGDLIAFFCAGAYCAVMSNSYNSRDIIPEVLINDTTIKIIRERITQEALLTFEEEPRTLSSAHK